MIAIKKRLENASEARVRIGLCGVNSVVQYRANCESGQIGAVISLKLVNESNDRIFLIFSGGNRRAYGAPSD